MTARILLVEDDPVSRELVAALLSSRGHRVETVSDGFGALRLAQSKPFDLILVDYHLPEMDGYALARLMRSVGATADWPFRMVAITGDQFGLAARRGADQIFDSVLPKPIEPAALFALVDAILARSAGAGADTAGPAPIARGVAAQVGTGKGQTGRGDATDLDSAWRCHGLDRRPRMAVFPMPGPEDSDRLDQVVERVAPDAAEALLLLHAAGLAAVQTARARGGAFLQPLVAADSGPRPDVDAVLDLADESSRSGVATVLRRFAERRELLAPGIAATSDFDLRVAAYLFVAERPFEFRRDTAGLTRTLYAPGFPTGKLIESVKRLAAAGRVSARFDDAGAPGARRLVVDLTSRGIAAISMRAAERAAGAR